MEMRHGGEHRPIHEPRDATRWAARAWPRSSRSTRRGGATGARTSRLLPYSGRPAHPRWTAYSSGVPAARSRSCSSGKRPPAGRAGRGAARPCRRGGAGGAPPAIGEVQDVERGDPQRRHRRPPAGSGTPSSTTGSRRAPATAGSRAWRPDGADRRSRARRRSRPAGPRPRGRGGTRSSAPPLAMDHAGLAQDPQVGGHGGLRQPVDRREVTGAHRTVGRKLAHDRQPGRNRRELPGAGRRGRSTSPWRSLSTNFYIDKSRYICQDRPVDPTTPEAPRCPQFEILADVRTDAARAPRPARGCTRRLERASPPRSAAGQTPRLRCVTG